MTGYEQKDRIYGEHEGWEEKEAAESDCTVHEKRLYDEKIRDTA